MSGVKALTEINNWVYELICYDLGSEDLRKIEAIAHLSGFIREAVKEVGAESDSSLHSIGLLALYLNNYAESKL